MRKQYATRAWQRVAPSPCFGLIDVGMLCMFKRNRLPDVFGLFGVVVDFLGTPLQVVHVKLLTVRVEH